MARAARNEESYPATTLPPWHPTSYSRATQTSLAYATTVPAGSANTAAATTDSSISDIATGHSQIAKSSTGTSNAAKAVSHAANAAIARYHPTNGSTAASAPPYGPCPDASVTTSDIHRTSAGHNNRPASYHSSGHHPSQKTFAATARSVQASSSSVPAAAGQENSFRAVSRHHRPNGSAATTAPTVRSRSYASNQAAAGPTAATSFNLSQKVHQGCQPTQTSWIRSGRRSTEEEEKTLGCINNLYKVCKILIVSLTIFQLQTGFLSLSVSASSVQNSNLIIFDPVGSMAGSITYLHVAIPLNLTALEDQAKIIALILTNTTETFKSKITKNANQQAALTRVLSDISILLLNRLEHHLQKLQTVKDLLPSDFVPKTRQKRLVFLAPFIVYHQKYLAEVEAHNKTKLALDKLIIENKNLRNIISEMLDEPVMPDVDEFLPTSFPTVQNLMQREGISEQEMEQRIKRASHNSDTFKLTIIAKAAQRVSSEPSLSQLSRNDIEWLMKEHLAYETWLAIRDSLRAQKSAAAIDRQKRVAPLVVAGAFMGVLGTMFGLYTQKEIHQIQNTISTLQYQQDLLYQITNTHNQQIQTLILDMAKITNVVEALLHHNPTVFQARIEDQINLVAERLDTMIDVIQQLQLRRLSVRLLTSSQLSTMHNSLEQMASEKGLSLFPTRISDYFQLETSYVRQASDMHILLHVPCVHPDHQLVLYKYIGYPIQLPQETGNHEHTISHALFNGSFDRSSLSLTNPDSSIPMALFTKPETELIGISPANHYRLITTTELAMCNHRSRFILCDQHQTLRTKLEESCLGSLFKKSIEGAKKYCKFERRPLMETVYQVSTTVHMVYAPRAGTYPAICTNQTHFNIFLQVGNNRIDLPAGCTVELESNIISSDYDIRVTPDPVQTIWTWDPLSFPFSSFHDVTRTDQQIRAIHKDLRMLESSVISNQTWDNHFSHTLHAPSNYPWYWYAILMTISLMLIFIISCYLWKCTNVCHCCHRLIALYAQSPSPLPVHYSAGAPPPVYSQAPAMAPTATILCHHKVSVSTCPVCSLRFSQHP
jgi:hypothetical protein